MNVGGFTCGGAELAHDESDPVLDRNVNPAVDETKNQ
jgi:hypothetical protein